MITDEKKVNRLMDAAMEIYKFHEKGKGFFCRCVRTDKGELKHVYNSWEDGLRTSMERNLNRPMTKDEQTILALAIGKGQTPSLTTAERLHSMECLWGSMHPENLERRCQDLMRVMSSL